MSISTPDRTATRKYPIKPVRREGGTGSWWQDLGPRGRKAYKAAFAGYSLDAFDLIILTLTLTAIGTTFGVGKGATGALATVTLSASAIGGVLAGVLSDRARAHVDAHGRRLLRLHLPLRPRVELRDADGLPRLPGHRLRRRVGRRCDPRGGADPARGARQGARDHPELVGGRLGPRGDRLHDRVLARGRRAGLARADVDRDPPGAVDPLRAPQRRGRRGLLRDEAQGGAAGARGRAGQRDRDPAEADLPHRPAQDDGLRLHPRDGHPGRLLRDVHLDPDLPEGGAQPVRGRHQWLPGDRDRRRVPRLPERGL